MIKIQTSDGLARTDLLRSRFWLPLALFALIAAILVDSAQARSCMQLQREAFHASQEGRLSEAEGLLQEAVRNAKQKERLRCRGSEAG